MSTSSPYFYYKSPWRQGKRVPHSPVVIMTLVIDQYWEQIIWQRILTPLLAIRASPGDVAWMVKYTIKRAFQRLRRLFFTEVFQPGDNTDRLGHHHFVTPKGLGKNCNITNMGAARRQHPLMEDCTTTYETVLLSLHLTVQAFRVSQPQPYGHFGWIILCGGSCPVYFRVVSGIPSLYPLDISRIPLQLWQPKCL